MGTEFGWYLVLLLVQTIHIVDPAALFLIAHAVHIVKACGLSILLVQTVHVVDPTALSRVGDSIHVIEVSFLLRH